MSDIIFNIADPDEVEVLSPEDFERLTLIDRRAEHQPWYTDLKTKKKVFYDPMPRSWQQTRGVTMHQTACDMGERIERYDTIGAHFAVLRSGRILRMCDVNRIVYHGHGWNNQCIGIEVNGLYPGLEDDPTTVHDEALQTTWDDPSTPTREQPQKVTPQAMKSTRYLLRWLYWHVAQNGGNLITLGGHRQAVDSRRNDPGQAIWQQVVLPIQKELMLNDGGKNFKLPASSGYVIPEAWNPDYKGNKY